MTPTRGISQALILLLFAVLVPLGGCSDHKPKKHRDSGAEAVVTEDDAGEPEEEEPAEEEPEAGEEDAGDAAIADAQADAARFDPPLPSAVKAAFGADPAREDTDGDGLSDEFEIRFGFPTLKPDSADSDGDGTADSAEDSDSDGLTNLQEQEHNIGPLDPDSDADGLPDGEEIARKADPLKADTDSDGMADGREVTNGSDPLVADADKVITSTWTFTATGANGAPERIRIAVTGKGDLAARITLAGGSDFAVAGQVSRRFELTLPEGAELQKALVTIPYDAAKAGANTAGLALYTVNPQTGFWEALPGTVDTAAATVTGETTHFSPFFVADKAALQSSVAKLPRTCDATDDPNAAPAEVVLVIDSSGSMATNDKDKKRITAAQNFANAMKDSDRVAVVDFDSVAKLLIGPSGDKAAVSAAIGRIDSSGNTDIGAGVSLALGQFSANADKKLIQAVVLLTDGQGAYNEALTAQMAERGIRAFTIGLSSAVDAALLQRIATGTQGGYRLLTDPNGLIGIFGQFSTVFGDDGRDTDMDGLSDCTEVQGVYLTNLGRIVKTDPQNPDQDGDGISDGAEVGDLHRSSDASTPWAAAGHSDPTQPDTDGDGISDPDEYRLVTNAFSSDTDADGLSDADEVLVHETDPGSSDTDGDGLSDSEEVRRKAEGFDPTVFDYKRNFAFQKEFIRGFLLGDIAEIDTVPELLGQLVSGLFVVGDIRDFFANAFKGEWVAAGLNAVGIIPAAGDIAKSSAYIVKFLAKYPERYAEVARNVERLFPETAAKILPAAAVKRGAWLLKPFERGRVLEVKLAASVNGRALLGKFPKFDVWNAQAGHAVSIKTLDLNANSYQNVSAFRSAVKRYANNMNFKPGEKRLVGKAADGMPVRIAKEDVLSQELVLGVPRKLSADFQKAIDDIEKLTGVKISVREIE